MTSPMHAIFVKKAPQTLISMVSKLGEKSKVRNALQKYFILHIP
jgi:hypothetical protein